MQKIRLSSRFIAKSHNFPKLLGSQIHVDHYEMQQYVGDGKKNQKRMLSRLNVVVWYFSLSCRIEIQQYSIWFCCYFICKGFHRLSVSLV